MNWHTAYGMTKSRMSSQTPSILIAGGGPAGIMLGFLLARAGISVTVLEKHKDFLRDFRGDTIHASTLQLMHELGLQDQFLKLPHQKITRFTGRFGNEPVAIADFSHLPTRAKFIAFMPQWDFLDFIAGQGRRYPTFSLRMGAKAQALLRDASGRVTGVTCRNADGAMCEITADLVVACDGRHSELRKQSGLEVIERGAPIDVVWFRLPRAGNDPEELLGRVDLGRVMVLINRGAYYQCAWIINKGNFQRVQQAGIEAFRWAVAASAPFLADRVESLRSFDDVKLLTVQVNRLQTWHQPGLLCLGDAAHAMSPVGGIGIQDAVAAANALYRCWREGRALDSASPEIQARREAPTKMIQAFQIAAQNMLARRYLNRRPDDGGPPAMPPWPVRLLTRFPILQHLPARFIGLGPRPEQIGTPDVLV
jgi:2-polyprenyl-6-methoxyphenol hydroxylase-like FAD-dependent oxidoreductase